MQLVLFAQNKVLNETIERKSNVTVPILKLFELMWNQSNYKDDG